MVANGGLKRKILTMNTKLGKVDLDLLPFYQVFREKYLGLVEQIRENRFRDIMSLGEIILSTREMKRNLNKIFKNNNIGKNNVNRFFLKLISLTHEYFTLLYTKFSCSLMMKYSSADVDGKYTQQVMRWCEFNIENYFDNKDSDNKNMSDIYNVYSHLLTLPQYKQYHTKILNIII